MPSDSDLIAQTDLEEYKPFTILIVDDDPVFRQLANRLLSRHGYKVLEARSTKEAEPLLRYNPDLLIVDYRMPISNGDVWIKKLRDRGIKTPIVFCSASAYTAPVHAKLRNVLQVDLIVRKPIDEATFVRQLQSLLPRAGQAIDVSLLDEDLPLITDEVARLFEYDDRTNEHHPVETNTSIEDYASGEEYGYETSQSAMDLPESLARTAAAALENADQLKTQAAINDLATLYLTELPVTSLLLREELTASREHNVRGSLQKAARRAHKMKGAAGSLGFVDIHKLAGQLEDCLIEAAIPNDSGARFDYRIFDDLLESLDQSIKTAQDCDSGRTNAKMPPIAKHAETITVPRFLILSSDASESLHLASLLNSYHSAIARSLRDAISVFSMLEDYRPDLLFIDAALLGTSGYDICRMIRCNPLWSHMPIVFMVDVCSSQCRVRIFESGGNDFVVKPANEIELIMRVGNLLNWTSSL